MQTNTIAEAKNNLSQLIHQLERGESISLTRYGKPVAVLMSQQQYQNLLAPEKSLHQAILSWRSELEHQQDPGFNEQELQAIRHPVVERDSPWND